MKKLTLTVLAVGFAAALQPFANAQFEQYLTEPLSVHTTTSPRIAVKLDDPSFPTPIFANLVEAEGSYTLVWSR